jgi:hypothetical protein
VRFDVVNSIFSGEADLPRCVLWIGLIFMDFRYVSISLTVF